MRRGDGGKQGGRSPRGGAGGRPLRLALWLAGALVVALGLAQIFLPRIAASRISSRLGKYGDVRSVHVSAWPAVELLWGEADAVTVRARSISVSPAQTGKLLHEARGLHELDLTAETTREGPLPLHDVSLRKRAAKLHAQASLSEADVKAALPPGYDVQLLGSSRGQVQVRASGGLFGVGASVDAVKLTLFSDPRVYIQGIGARRSDAGDGAAGGAGYVLSIDASLR